MAENSNTQNQSASFFEELGEFMKPYTKEYILSMTISVLGVMAKLGAYIFVGMIAEMLFEQNATVEKVFLLGGGAVLCKILDALFVNSSTWISHKAAYFTLRDIRKGLTEKMMKLPIGYFEENGSGRMKNMLVDNIEGMEKTLAHMLPELTANVLAPFAIMVWMFFIDWRLALCVVLWIILGFSVTCGMMCGYEKKYAGQLAASKTMNQAVVEFVGGIEVIKNFGRADECYKKYEDAVYGHASYNANWMKETQIYSSLGMALAPYSVFPVLIAGMIFYQNGTLEPGTLFLMVILTFGIFGPLMSAMMYFDRLAQMGTDAREMKSVLEYPELKRGTCEETNAADVRFSHVTFAYEKGEKSVLNDVSVHVKTGTMLALVGPSGSGKSTIAKLLAGYWDADEGEILIGNKPIFQYSQEELNRKIAYVEQETFLFDVSIMENIRMGNPDATDEQVIEAAKRAGCDDFIRALPEGYQTHAGMAGGRLSGGERQRIAIARAMMKDAPIMILDEATASADPENEASIQQALSAATKGKTLIVVAHRLSTIMNAEQIAFVKAGELKQIGTHKQLLENCSEYAEMWMLQEVN